MKTTTSPRFWTGDVTVGALAFILTSMPVALGVIFSTEFIPQAHPFRDGATLDYVDACFHFDAFHYLEIAEHGYSYDPAKSSSVAFFPVYPLVSQWIDAFSSWRTRVSLLVTGNLMLLGAFIFLSAYLRSRFSQETPRNRFLILAMFGLAPAGFFFRMPYSESTFLLLTFVTLVGMVRRWPLTLVALLAGAVTAVRPVGVAVTAAFVWQILVDADRGPMKRRVIVAIGFLPIACWGLLSYMTYQFLAFDAPLGFAETQQHWTNLTGPPRGEWDKITSLLSGEPVWGAYTSDADRNWRHRDSLDNDGLFGMFFWNPIIFVATGILIFVGYWKSWLSSPETVMSALLLAIPYVTRAYEMCMASQGRFAAVAFPTYIVLGRLLSLLPEWVTWVVIGAFATMLMIWSALFAAGHLLI